MAVLALTILPAFAANAGVAGHVIGPGGTPVANAKVAIFRLPLRRVDQAVATLNTDKKGFFVMLPLEPGRYMLDASVPGDLSDCSVHQLVDESVTHVTMRLHARSGCTPLRVHPTMVNGALTADVYIVH